ncbi:hypothetical protein HanIR_Chr04g0185251 [Helianthus annuus]|nr:hypothetical protein HanIR_Chr04g0185251 [Helianthus annuus]
MCFVRRKINYLGDNDSLFLSQDRLLIENSNIKRYPNIRAVNEPNVQRTVCEPFGGKFVYVRSISLTNEHE